MRGGKAMKQAISRWPAVYGLFAIKRGERPRSLAVRMSLPRGEAAQ
jgi:hypothetical protein